MRCRCAIPPCRPFSWASYTIAPIMWSYMTMIREACSANWPKEAMLPCLIHTQPAIHCASVTEHSGRQLDPASSVPSLIGRASCQMVKAHHALKYSGSFKVSLLSLVSHRSHCRRRMGMTVPLPLPPRPRLPQPLLVLGEVVGVEGRNQEHTDRGKDR